MRNLSRLIRLFIGVLGLFVLFQTVWRLWRRLFPAPSSTSRLLDSPVRELGQPRHDTLRRIGLGPGQRVLELGMGHGYLTIEAAGMLQPEGRLTAVDSEPQMVALVAEKLQRAGLENVELRVADARRLPFPAGTFDTAFLVTALGGIPDKGRALRELRRVLKPNGRLSITEAVTDPDYMLTTEVVGWAQTVGFELVEQHGNALLYTLNFRSLLGP